MCLNQRWVWSKYKSFGYHVSKSEENLSSYKTYYKALFPGIDRVGIVSVTFSIKCSNRFHIFFILDLIILNTTLIEILPAQDYFSTITPDLHHVKEYNSVHRTELVYIHQFNMAHNCLWRLLETIELPLNI